VEVHYDAEPAVIPKAGHIMQFQNPEAFNTTLKAFLARH
jgi:pimeloyl-ACP methyl ester carboxylesterase